MKIICITNLKGGVGKTTSTQNLAAGIALNSGKKVIAADNDSQGCLTRAFGFNPPDVAHTIANLYHAVIDELDLERYFELCLLPTSVPNLTLLPSNNKLLGVDQRLSVMNNPLSGDLSHYYILKKMLSRLEEQFDYVLIDCGPKIDMLTLSGLASAQFVIVPVQTQYLGSGSINEELEMLHRVKKEINPSLKIGGILLNMCQERTNLGKGIANKIKKTYQSYHVFEQHVTYSVRVAESPAFGISIHEYKAKVKEAIVDEIVEQYNSIVEEILLWH